MNARPVIIHEHASSAPPHSFAGLFVALRHVDPVDIRGVVDMVRIARIDKKRIFFVGNGGSAAIASHMAADYLKTCGVAAMCFNDAAQITCIANDIGYDQVFAKPLLLHGRKGDLLFAISSSGRSRSITAAVEVAIMLGMKTVTLSGFDADNTLHHLGDVNFHIPSHHYGVVEVAHHAICHAILDEVVNAG